MSAILYTESLRKKYEVGEQVTYALDGLSFDIEKGKTVAIVGRSGSGKSTLLNMLGGLDIPDEGKVVIDDKDITALTEDERTVFRRKHIGYVYQNYNLISILTAYENIILPLQLDGRTIDENKIDNLLEMLEIKDKKYNYPDNMSGGQQQRVAIARALVMEPDIILADEPTGNLDSSNSEKVMNILIDSCKKLHQTVLIITHDENIAKMADDIIRIEDGKTVALHE